MSDCGSDFPEASSLGLDKAKATKKCLLREPLVLNPETSSHAPGFRV